MIVDQIKRIGLFALSLPILAILAVIALLFAPLHYWLKYSTPTASKRVEYRNKIISCHDTSRCNYVL